MQVPTEAVLVRIFLGEADRAPDGLPLYEAVVLKAREMELAGATVLRGPMGFGRNSHLHTAKILRLSEDLPMVVEIVDAEAKVRALLLEAIEPMMGSGLVTAGARPGDPLRDAREGLSATSWPTRPRPTPWPCGSVAGPTLTTRFFAGRSPSSRVTVRPTMKPIVAPAITSLRWWRSRSMRESPMPVASAYIGTPTFQP